ncbi:hypothetical protein [Pseudomonas atacamensis]|uniref:hypothetical protein n=1 Tax=Pseudomonas atacamensis TaxID=2565368 RepID=UPI0019D23A23|nr:hypothetical protein [Pseudomonas atacamensis]QSL90454.1 hypothetical protein JWU58_26820 [Pseudomonas atacamensis]
MEAVGGKKVKSWVQWLKPYNTHLIALGFVLDGVAVAWVYFETLPIPPWMYGVATGLLKIANLGIHFINKKLIEEGGDDSQADAAASQ